MMMNFTEWFQGVAKGMQRFIQRYEIYRWIASRRDWKISCEG